MSIPRLFSTRYNRAQIHFVQSLIKINRVDAIPNLSKQLLFVTAYKLLAPRL